jgi:hypothetical protein
MTNIINTAPYLRTSWLFPPEIGQLTVELQRSYTSIAENVNVRTIGLYPTNFPSVTGNGYFFTSRRQQSLRQLYYFTSTSNINIGFKLANIGQIIQMYGIYLSGTSYYGLIPASNVAIAGQRSFYVAVNNASTTSDVITFVAGAGAPALTSGTIILEWLSNA